MKNPMELLQFTKYSIHNEYSLSIPAMIQHSINHFINKPYCDIEYHKISVVEGSIIEIK